MKEPNDETIVRKAIKLLLASMQNTDDDLPCKAEENIALAVMLLNQITCESDFGSYELNEQLKYCRNFIQRKKEIA